MAEVEIVGALAKVGGAVLVPMAVTALAKMLIHAIEPPKFNQVPFVTMTARLAGVLAAALLLYANLDARDFDLELLFVPDSPWNLSLGQFLTERAMLFEYSWGAVLDTLSQPSTPFAVLLVAAGLFALPLAASVPIGRLWGGTDALRAVAASTGILIWSAWMTVYLVCLLFWALHELNFWALALLVVYLQYRRYSH
ncbi:MAG: hypothetical protein HQL38_06265 [Alphaproteobacteria bacterium]|nr:hypothetical protein [Alphaproteobacteria bacterium]